MRGDLREKLAAVWGKHEKTGVTPVTGVTRGTSGLITHATENVTVVTKDSVTPQDTNGYGGYEGYVSKIAIAREAGKRSVLTVAKSRVTGGGIKAPAVPCPTDIAERSAIIAEGKGFSRADGWSAEDWQIFFDERAGIVEFDGRQPRPKAEAQAFACCVVEWLNRNPERSPAGYCLGCGGRDHAHDPLLPHGIEPTGHAWLHSRCWPAWYEARKARAVAALAAMGITAAAGPSILRAEQSGRS